MICIRRERTCGCTFENTGCDDLDILGDSTVIHRCGVDTCPHCGKPCRMVVVHDQTPCEECGGESYGRCHDSCCCGETILCAWCLLNHERFCDEQGWSKVTE